MTCHFNDLQPTFRIVHAAVLYDDITTYRRSYMSKIQHRRLLAAINRGVEYITGFRDTNLGCVYETILLDVTKPYVDGQ